LKEARNRAGLGGGGRQLQPPRSRECVLRPLHPCPRTNDSIVRGLKGVNINMDSPRFLSVPSVPSVVASVALWRWLLLAIQCH
jgi:hypothetical protein